jgi:hypothetical protein
MYNGRRLLGSRARATGAPWLACFLLLSLADLPPAMSADSAIDKYAKMRKHPFLFQPWPADVFDPKFLELVQSIKEGKSLEELLQSKLLVKQVDGVYSFPMLKHDFCDKFLAEIDSYFASGLPIRRPNSMNNYGLIVNEIGMEPSITALQQQYILPLAKLLYPKQGHAFHAHHSFMVEYKAGHDLGLDMHTDDSDVTLNVCMGREFTGAGLSFCGYVGQPDHRLFQTAYQVYSLSCSLAFFSFSFSFSLFSLFLLSLSPFTLSLRPHAYIHTPAREGSCGDSPGDQTSRC